MGRKKIIDDDALLAHARAVFLERGAFGTTKEVAQRAEVSEALIYQRYPTKAQLFTAAMMAPEVEVEAMIAAEIEDVRAALVETGLRLLKHLRRVIPTAMHLLIHPSVSAADLSQHFASGRVTKIMDLLGAFLAERAARGEIRVPNPQAAAHLFMAAVHSLAVYEMLEVHGGSDLEHAVPLFVDALWEGLRPDGGLEPEP